MNTIDMQVLALSSKYAVPEGWEVFIWETINMDTPNEAIQFTGAVVNETFKSGPRKGRKNFSKRDKSTEMKLVMTREELFAFQDKWGAENDTCPSCWGSGKTMQSWSIHEGTTYRKCHRCKGDGKFVEACK